MTSIVAGIVSAVLLSVLTVIRLSGKRAVRSWGLDDLFVTISFALALVVIGLSIHSKLNFAKATSMFSNHQLTFYVFIVSYCGLGQHMWDLQDGQVIHVLESMFIAMSIFPVLIALIKISLVLLYLGIFPSKGFQIAAWTAVTFIGVSGLAMELFAIFTCSPVQHSWNKDIKPGYCIPETYPSGMGAIVGVVQDVAVVVLPVIQVRRLQMKKRQKMLVMSLFCLGAL
jgi:hypothetical protein